MIRAAGFFLSILLLIGLYSCKKPYTPSIVESYNNYLVVEGVINAGSDSTIINLSRTVNVNNTGTYNPEIGALVQVQGADNTSYPLTEIVVGKYYVVGLNLDNSKKYRLSIKTAKGEQYYSDYEPVLITPPIDSVTYKPVNNQLNIYVNTHDPKNLINYYRYSYQETWEFHSKFGSSYYADGLNIVPRPVTDNVFNCWGNHKSNTITLGSTAGLSQDLLSQLLLTYINSTDEKLESRYSILVNQYALSEEAYNFWVELKKNTENLGTIFDSFPSSVQGNIHSAGSTITPVIGYVGVSTVASQRIFITHSQIPSTWYQPYPYDCLIDTVTNDKLYLLTNVPHSLIPISTTPTGGYLSSSPQCTDCTVRGTNKRPSYWPN